MSDLSDADLIEAVRNRGSEAFGLLYDRYGLAVYSLFLRTSRNPAAAEDLVQELFLRVWNRAPDFDAQRGSVGVWILSIARNMAIDYIRSAQSRFLACLCPMDEVEHRASAHPQKRPVDSILDDIRTVESAFSYLSAKQKEVLELAYFEGLSQSEIAARLREPLGTVKSWIRSALLKMREAIERGGVK